MELQQERTVNFTDSVSLLDDLLSYKINSTTFMENEMLVKTLCDAIDTIVKKEGSGYILMSIGVGKNTSIKLLNKSDSWFHLYSWTTQEKLEKPINIVIHEEGNEDLRDWISKQADTAKIRNDDTLFTNLIGESLTGLCISKKNVTDHINFMKQHEKEYSGIIGEAKFERTSDLATFFQAEVDKVSNDIKSTITDYADRLKCDKLKVNVRTEGLNMAPWFGVCHIDKVKQNGNTRTYQINIDRVTGDKIKGITLIGSRNAGVKSDSMNLKPIGNLAIAEIKDYYNEGPISALERIPYEFVDEGRTLILVNRGNYWNVIVGSDPRSATEDPIDNLKHISEQYIDTVLKRNFKVEAAIKDKDSKYDITQYEQVVSKEQPDIKPLQLKLKAMKRMLDEYQYIGKKEKAKGEDVTITDKVKYNHEKGEVSYNDFSFAVNDELIKNSFMGFFNQYVVEFYRGTLTEEQILNDILAKIFDAIASRLNAYGSNDTNITIKLNNKVDVNLQIKAAKNGAHLIYVNGQRFNRNEVITVLKEMTCYRSQEEADMFISNIGKLGLSVYIAISTGYEVEFRNKNNREEVLKRIFKFRKHKGRSSYSLILDTIEINITGKTLINTLYNKFIGENVPYFDDKIPKLIMSSVGSSLDYAKYKFLIDSTYEAFQKNSVDFLAKKVEDVGGKFCKYFNVKNNKVMDAIEVVGTTGNKYVITYDKTNSWVFMNPETREDGAYKDGKYVCMIDQSNIKSNIGYDTVIAKLLALKNDSVIAGKIYNLQEEING